MDCTEVRRNAIKWLTEHQLPDGGWGEPESSVMETTMATYSLYRLGKTKPAKKGREWIAGSQMPSGAWIFKYRGESFLKNDPMYNDLWGLELITPTAMSLITLMYTSRKTKSLRKTIDKGCNWLLTKQFKSGGFKAENENKANAGMTSLSLWALVRANAMYGSELSKYKEIRAAIVKGGLYLTEQQQKSGAYPSTPGRNYNVDGLIAVSKVYATAEDLCGFVEYAADHKLEIGNPVIHRGLRWLSKQQLKRGGWGHLNRIRVEETAYALLLAQQLVNKKIDYPAYLLPAQKGLAKLLSMQKDGYWHRDYRHTATFNTAFASMVIPKGRACVISD